MAAVHCICKQSHCIPDLLGFSATQAMVMPPISESLNRSRKVPLGLDISMSCACCLFTKPRMALWTHIVTQWNTRITGALSDVHSTALTPPSLLQHKAHLKVTQSWQQRSFLISTHHTRQINLHSRFFQRENKWKWLPIIPVRLQMFLHKLYYSIKPLPEGEVASR